VVQISGNRGATCYGARAMKQVALASGLLTAAIVSIITFGRAHTAHA
jgi:hypothetical protein